MIRPERVAALLLAAGMSVRFGNEDKLLTPFLGRPLAAHARDAISSIHFACRVAVVRARAPVLSALLEEKGFALVENPAPADGLGSSLRLGVAAVTAMDVDAMLICLGDMPRVDTALLRQLCERYDPAVATLVCCDHDRRTPPALIGRVHFDALTRLAGDTGARALLRDAPTLAVSSAVLHDIDRPCR
jgi:molybdenum cofactor cytidylyltransferase